VIPPNARSILPQHYIHINKFKACYSCQCKCRNVVAWTVQHRSGTAMAPWGTTGAPQTPWRTATRCFTCRLSTARYQSTTAGHTPTYSPCTPAGWKRLTSRWTNIRWWLGRACRWSGQKWHRPHLRQLVGGTTNPAPTPTLGTVWSCHTRSYALSFRNGDEIVCTWIRWSAMRWTTSAAGMPVKSQCGHAISWSLSSS
jgi:hypothetical protein